MSKILRSYIFGHPRWTTTKRLTLAYSCARIFWIVMIVYLECFQNDVWFVHAFLRFCDCVFVILLFSQRFLSSHCTGTPHRRNRVMKKMTLQTQMVILRFYSPLGGGLKAYLSFHPYLRRCSDLIHIFQMGWNQQLVPFITCEDAPSQPRMEGHTTVVAPGVRSGQHERCQGKLLILYNHWRLAVYILPPSVNVSIVILNEYMHATHETGFISCPYSENDPKCRHLCS